MHKFHNMFLFFLVRLLSQQCSLVLFKNPCIDQTLNNDFIFVLIKTLLNDLEKRFRFGQAEIPSPSALLIRTQREKKNRALV